MTADDCDDLASVRILQNFGDGKIFLLYGCQGPVHGIRPGQTWARQTLVFGLKMFECTPLLRDVFPEAAMLSSFSERTLPSSGSG